MSARDDIIEKANDLTRYVENGKAQLAEYKADLAELRTLCPWAFGENGKPLPDPKKRGGRQL